MKGVDGGQVFVSGGGLVRALHEFGLALTWPLPATEFAGDGGMRAGRGSWEACKGGTPALQDAT